ncbi:hypothetical protein ANO14919_029610 [Xylariales sp. No.14919]|nr:hypothetical protein ANO14919_029610 [Xylariales sp. No.14919]
MTLASRLELLVVLDMTILFFPFGISALARLILFPVMMVLKRGLEPIFQLLEDALTEEKPWFSGSQFGLADFNVCWGMDTASQRGYFNPARFPRLVEWHTKVKARAGYQSALEKGNGYNLKTFGV